ncbi:MAG: flagellar motor protein MotB [Bryobacterales bacterium]|nr:flagellar motor protein MotB [Bryobacterales bacterium]
MSNRNATNNQPIVIIKKVVAGGHHGGAWKVAYADFVTAMMALFIVLWLMNASPEIQKAVSLYFTDPRGFQDQDGTGNVGSGDGNKALLLNKEDMPDLKNKLTETLKSMPELGALKQVDMTVTGDGLRIELVDKEGNSFFESGAKEMTGSAKAIVSALAEEIGKLENPVVLEGHTDARPYSTSGYYSNWDLSTDRANAAAVHRRNRGTALDQRRSQLRGFADQHLRNPKDPLDYANRRVSIIVGFVDAPEPAKAPADAGKTGAHEIAGQTAGGRARAGRSGWQTGRGSACRRQPTPSQARPIRPLAGPTQHKVVSVASPLGVAHPDDRREIVRAIGLLSQFHLAAPILLLDADRTQCDAGKRLRKPEPFHFDELPALHVGVEPVTANVELSHAIHPPPEFQLAGAPRIVAQRVVLKRTEPSAGEAPGILRAAFGRPYGRAASRTQDKLGAFLPLPLSSLLQLPGDSRLIQVVP